MPADVSAFGPAIAASVAIQKLIEIIDGLLEWAMSWRKVAKDDRPGRKRLVTGLLSVGIAFAFSAPYDYIRILKHLGTGAPAALDVIVTALVIGGGTEGINSILKMLGYAKEQRKAEAGEASEAVNPYGLPKPPQFGRNEPPPR